jgi:hypothetical protein
MKLGAINQGDMRKGMKKLRNKDANTCPNGKDERLWYEANEPLAKAEQ